jgi:tetratricopeptide (TPR) repeat protein
LRALPSKNNLYYDKFMELSEKVISKAEKAIDKNENDYDALYYLGLSRSYRSLLMLSLNKSLLKAASNGNDGYKILKTLIEKKPDYYDAYMGLGLYKIAIGHVPDKFQWLLSLIGFDGNIKEGMSYLRISLTKGKFTRVDSKVFLSLFSLKEKEEKDLTALNYAKDLEQDYPESPLFKVLYSSLLLQHGSSEDAIRMCEEALSINSYSFQDEIQKNSAAVMGVAYFRQNDFQRAIQNLEEFMKYANDEDRYNVYLFTLGISYELSGNRKEALERYKRVRKDFVEERDGELDKYFYRLAQEKIRTPVSNLDRKLIEGLNYRESGKPDESLEIYAGILNSNLLNSDDDKIRFYFDLGLAYFYEDDFDKAIDSFTKCLNLKPGNEKWLLPHACFELGKAFKKKGNVKKSNEMFEQIADYDDFDFESFLDMRLANYLNN